jgi:hypothetical protein
MKNRKQGRYKKGQLKVPDEYKYLAANAAKRDPNASRVSKGAQHMKRQKEERQARRNKGKGKQRAEPELDDEEDGEDDGAGQPQDADGEELGQDPHGAAIDSD